MAQITGRRLVVVVFSISTIIVLWGFLCLAPIFAVENDVPASRKKDVAESPSSVVFYAGKHIQRIMDGKVVFDREVESPWVYGSGGGKIIVCTDEAINVIDQASGKTLFSATVGIRYLRSLGGPRPGVLVDAKGTSCASSKSRNPIPKPILRWAWPCTILVPGRLSFTPSTRQ